LDELYKGYVPNEISKENRIIDSRISKYEEKLLKTDEMAFHLYQAEFKNRMFSKEKSKKHIKELLQEVLTHVKNEELNERIIKQIEKY